MTYGFSAVALPQLHRHENVDPGHEPWIASTVTLCAPIGCLISGLFLDRLGRRIMMILCVIPVAAGWFITGFAKDSSIMIVGRVITGIGGGMSASPPRAYCTEIALPRIRGVIGVFPTLALSIGITVQSVLGTFLNWDMLCYISGSYSLFLVCLNWFLPETPYFLLVYGTITTAEKSLRKFRAKLSRIDLEIDEMKKFKQKNNITGLSLKQSLKAIFKPNACKPFCIIAMFVLCSQLSGVMITLFYAVDILQETQLPINAYVGNIVLASSRIVGGLMASILAYNMKRRPLALVSAGGVAIVALSLGIILLYAPPTPTLFPLISLSVLLIFATLGYLSLPLLMIFEMVPLQIRGLLGGLMVSLWTFSMFCANTAFPYVKAAIGLPKTFVSFGMISLIGCSFLFFFLPETMGLSLTEIEEFYNKKRQSLQSVRSSQPLKTVSAALLPGLETIKEDEEPHQFKKKPSVTFSKTDIHRKEPNNVNID